MPLQSQARPFAGHSWVDDTRRPVYQLTYPRHPEEDEVVARNAEIHEWYKSLDHRIAWVVDCSHVISASATVRRLQTEHLKRIEYFAARWDVGNAFVVPSSLLRGYMTAIFWFSPPPYRYQTFASLAPAFAWTEARLAEHHISLRMPIARR
jgi:hypothetical protein